jgi:hypothetical protein
MLPFKESCWISLEKMTLFSAVWNNCQIFMSDGIRNTYFSLYRTAHRLGCVHLNFTWYEGTHSGALQPFKCTVHSCRGLEL